LFSGEEMKFVSPFLRALRWLAVASLLAGGLAMAQSEPSVSEIYAAAQAGRLEQAQVMVQQVLVSHPNSAKAHFIQSELYARQGNLPRAREALATAEKLAPGLPFAKADAVQALRGQLASRAAVTTQGSTSNYSPPAVASSSGSWLLPLGLTAGVIVLGYFLFRRRAPQPMSTQPAYSEGLAGPQTFGTGGGTLQPSYGQPGYGSAPYGQAGGTGLGGRIMGGVATGLAVGAGVVAAEAIGRRLLSDHDQPAPLSSGSATNDFQALDTNVDMGGQDFGLTDTAWDDGGSAGGSGDWDN
jgi:hypothetical protein